jgi:hypothetical protein
MNSRLKCLSTVRIIRQRYRSHLDVAVYMIVNPLGVRHVLQHDVAHLQYGLAESYLE